MSAAFLGMACAPPCILDREEAAALVEVLQALRAHPAVAWCDYRNAGATQESARFVRYGWPGCPDVLGRLKDGRLLGVEVQSSAGKPAPERAELVGRIRAAGGVAFLARDSRDVRRELQAQEGKT